MRTVPALPFPIPVVSAGFAALSASARAIGARAAERAAAALSVQLGVAVEIDGRPLPALATPAPGMVRLGLSLDALAAPALLEVEASLAVCLVDRLAGGEGPLPPALTLTPIERSALELLALVAIAGAAEVPPVADHLAPMLAAAAEEPPNPLAVEITVAAGPLRGRCRLLLPAEALRRLEAPGELAGPVAAWVAPGWLSSGGARLAPEELAALAPGDVLLLDEGPSDAACLHLPGLRLHGRLEGDDFHLEEPTVDPSTAELSLELTVELARVSITLGDLARVEAGGAIPLHAPRDGRVVLRLGDRPVARGQLVEIDGALGVRIERLEGRP